MKLYEIRNSENDAVYVGVTRNTLANRYRSHKHSSKTAHTPLYCAMRKYGFDKFSIELVYEFETEDEMLKAEKDRIAFYRQIGIKCYNILDGGESYFPIKNWESYRAVLREKRKGRKPALGMKHTDENKKLFSECGKARWDKYGRYPDEIILLSFKDAKEKYGISKTHYYRLAKSNDLS